jgi:hypothetical protein
MQPVFYMRSGSLQSFWWLTSIVLVAHFARNWWPTWSEYALELNMWSKEPVTYTKPL